MHGPAVRAVQRWATAARGRAAMLAVLALSLSACKGLGDITSPKPVNAPVVAVSLSTETFTLAIGNSLALQATALDIDGQRLSDRKVYWSTSDSTIAVVSDAGVVTAVRTGRATIAASVDGRSATAQLTVTARAVASVQVTPNTPSLLVGGFLQLSARTLDESGNVLTGRPVFWSTSDPRIAVVDVSGLVTGIAEGLATVTATSELRNASVGVTVAPVPVATVQLTPARDTIVLGQATQLTATPRDSTGAVLANRVVTWTTSSASIATVSSSGLVLGITPGTVTITASSSGKSNTSTIVVQPRPVGAVIVSPAQTSLTVGQTAQLSVQITDGSGNLLTGRPTSFSSGNANVAQVDNNGKITATAPGSTTITVTSEGKVGTASVTVAASPIATLRVSPDVVSLIVGGSTKLSATALDAGGNPLAQRSVAWTSGAPAIASVAADGTVNALAAGTAIIFAAAEGKIASSTITITAPSPSAVTVNPSSTTIIAGTSQDFSAVLRDAGGQIITGRPVQWSSANNSIAVVSSSGRVRGVSPGATRIDATVDGQVGSSNVTVVPVPVASVTVTLASAAILVGQTTQATAVARDSIGGLLTGRAVTWSSTNTAVATVSNTGLVTAVALGSATIRATVETQTGSATLSVVVGQPTTIAANSVVSQSTTAGSVVTAPPSVKVTDAGGSAVAGVAVTFTITGGGGTISPASPATVTTNASGVATLTSWTLGNVAGTNTLTAAVTGLTGSPVTFTASGTVGSPTTIAANSVTSQTVVSGSPVTTPPSVKVTDAVGNPVQGVVVTFAITAGGGTTSPASPASVTTNASGIATLTSWTLGGTAGANSLTASVAGLAGSPVTFSATGTVGAATTIAANSATTQSAAVGTAVATPPSVKVTDANGNAVSGVSVTFAVTAGGGAIAPLSVTTNASGLATLTSWTLGTTAGANTVTATATGLAGSPVTFNATGTAGAAKNIASNSVTTQSATAGTAVAAAPSVKVTDASGNPVSGVVVAFAVTAGGGAVAPATVSTNASGIATLTSWTLGTVAGANTATATVAGLTGSPVTFSATGNVGAAALLGIITQPSGATSGQNLTTQPVIEIRDSNGNRTTSTAAVTASVASGLSLLTGTTTVNAVNGRATFTDLRLTGLGTVTLQFASTGLTSVTSASVSVTAGAPTTIAANSVTTQSAVAGTAVAAPPSVKVTDLLNNPVSGVSVTFAVTAGGGSVSSTSVTTDANGLATLTSWTLGTVAGANTVTATVNGLLGSPVTFNATGTVGAATTLVANSVTSQSRTISTAVTAPPSVKVTDINGNGVSGVSVTFTLTAGGGSIVPASPATIVTNASGVATLTSWTLGATAGANTVSAAATGLTGSPIVFTATGTVGTPTTIAANSVTTQSTVAGTAVATPPSVKVTDAGGNPVTGVTVTFAVASGGGSVTPATVNTNASGIATATSWTLGTTAGANSVTASATGLTGSPVTFSATGTVGTATKLLVVTEPAGAVSGIAFTTQPVVNITDVNGNRTTSTASVTAAIATGTGTLSGTTTVAAVNGQATFANLKITGTGSHSIVFTSTALTSDTTVVFTVNAGTPTTIAANSVVTQSATAGSNVAAPPSVVVTDVNGTPVPGVSVTFALTAGGGSITPASPATVVTNASGIATLTSWTLGTAAGANTLTATATGLSGSPVTFNATGTVGAPTQISAVSVTTQSTTISTAVAAPPSVKVADANGNGVSGVSVVFTVASGGGSTSPASPATVTTNASGIATLTSWTVGSTAGANTVTAASTGLTGSPITFTATGTAGAATTIAANSVTTQSTTAGSAVSAPPSVKVTDAGNNPVSGVTVNFAVASGGGSVSPASVSTNASGIATLTSWTLGTTAGANSVTASSGTLTGSPVTFNATGTVGAANKLAITTQPSGAVSGSAFTSQPVIAIRDANNNLTSSTASVTVAIASGTGTLSGTTTVAAVNGVATFSNLQIVGTGAHTLTFTSTGLTSATSSSFTVAAGTPTQLAISTQPAGAVSGVALTTQPVVQIRDAGGNVTTSTANVTAAIASGSGALVGTTTVAAVNGVATFTNLQINGSGAHTITFTSGALTAATSSSLTVTQNAASLSVQTQPSGAVTGVAFTTQPVVRILDNAGLVVTTGASATAVVTAAVATGTGTLGGTLTATAVAGVATFSNLAITGTGAHTLQFSISSPALNVSSSSFTVAAGTATQVVMATQPAGAVSGVAFTTQPVVQLRDASNNVTTSTAAVTASIASGTGTLTGTTTVNAVNGVATFTDLKIAGSGAHTITFASTGLTSATSNSLTVTQTAASLSIQTQPGGAASGTAFTTQPVVRILDNAGLVVTTGTGATLNVTAAVASGTGTLSGTTTVAAVNGVATFTNLALTGSGAHTLQFTTSTPALSTTSSSFTLGAGAATQVVVATQPAGAVSGVAFTTQPVVQLRDASNNVTTSTAAVTASIASGTGTLSGTTTVNAVNGVATFTDLKIAGSGAHTLTFASTGLTSATSNSVTVTQTAASLSVQTQPSGATSGSAFTTQPVVRILDNAGLVVTSGTGATLSVTAAIASGTGTLSGTTTVAAVNGVATFTDLALTGSGTHTLQFTTSSPSLSVTSASISLGAGSPTQLAVSTQPAGAVSGVAFTTQPVVQIRDGSGNLTTSSASVTAAIASGTGTLVGTATVAAVNGVATFTNLQINGSGAHTITFTSGALTSATSSSFTVSQVAASLSVQTQPAGAVTGTAFTTQPVVRVLDNAGLLVTTGTGASQVITAAVATGSGTLGGTLTATASGGVATFTNLAITGTGAHTLQFSTTSPSLTVNSSSFTVAAGSPTQLAITTQPSGAVSGVNFTTQPVVQIRDAGGNLTSSTANVTATIATGTGTLVGTATVAAVGGVATFTNLRIDGSGAHTITFTSGALTAATSSSLTVTQVAASLSVQTQPSGAVSGSAFTTQPIVQVLDNAGLVVTTGTGATLNVTASVNSGTGTLLGTATVAAVNGVATFSGLGITGTGTGAHTLKFATTSPALNVTSNSVTVAAGTPTQLVLTTQPSGAVSGVNMTTQPVLEIRDANGNKTTSTLAVTVAVASGSGAVSGTLTVNAVNGTATFTDLQMAGVGAHTLSFSTTSPSLSVTSSSFTVTQVAASLTVDTQPAGAVDGVAFTTQPVVTIRDNAGLVIANSSLQVTAAVFSGTGTLVGTLAVGASSGVATFGDLLINGSGPHVLRFTTASPALSVNSASFTVN